MKKYYYYISFAFFLLLTACTPKVAEEISSDYVLLLDEYYRTLDQGNYLQLIGKLTNYLNTKDPRNMELRSMRGQLYLLQYLENNDQKAKDAFLKEMTFLSFVAANPVEHQKISDWVLPKVNNSLGHFFMDLGNDSINTNQIYAYQSYRAAEYFYSVAWQLAEDTSERSAGFFKEQRAAIDGFKESQLGVLAYSSFMGIKDSTQLQWVVDTAFARLQRVSLAPHPKLPVQNIPSIALTASAHNRFALISDLSANFILDDIQLKCAAKSNNQAAILKAGQELLQLYDAAGRHYLIGSILDPNGSVAPTTDEFLQTLNIFFRNSNTVNGICSGN